MQDSGPIGRRKCLPLVGMDFGPSALRRLTIDRNLGHFIVNSYRSVLS